MFVFVVVVVYYLSQKKNEFATFSFLSKIQATGTHWTIKAFHEHTFSLEFIVSYIEHLLQRFRRMIIDFAQPD